VAERWQRRNFEPLADSTVRAWRQEAQRPTLAELGDFETSGIGRGYEDTAQVPEWGTHPGCFV